MGHRVLHPVPCPPRSRSALRQLPHPPTPPPRNVLSQLACEFYPFPHFFSVKAHLSRLTSPVQGEAAGRGVSGEQAGEADTHSAQHEYHCFPPPGKDRPPESPLVPSLGWAPGWKINQCGAFKPLQGGEVPLGPENRRANPVQPVPCAPEGPGRTPPRAGRARAPRNRPSGKRISAPNSAQLPLRGRALKRSRGNISGVMPERAGGGAAFKKKTPKNPKKQTNEQKPKQNWGTSRDVCPALSRSPGVTPRFVVRGHRRGGVGPARRGSPAPTKPRRTRAWSSTRMAAALPLLYSLFSFLFPIFFFLFFVLVLVKRYLHFCWKSGP